MELLSLNMENGRHHDPLVKFLERQAKSVDIFCFQEVTSSSSPGTFGEGYSYDLLRSIIQALPGFVGRFDAYTEKLDFEGQKIELDLKLGQAFFIRQGVVGATNIEALFILGEHSQMMVDEGLENYPTLMQLADLKAGEMVFRTGNYHGIPRPGTKRDTAARIEQSRKIIDLVGNRSVPTIVAGDFNLLPDTRSVAMFEEAGFRNLVREFKVATTRSTLNRFYGTPQQQNFADYIFTRGVEVEAFEVLPDEVSDHLALKLKFHMG